MAESDPSVSEASTDFARTTIQDQVDRITMVLYLIAGVLFIGGLYFDVEQPKKILIAPLSIANDPSNSGLFIAAFIFLTAGFLIGRAAAVYQDYTREEVDQTQEWKVDISEE